MTVLYLAYQWLRIQHWTVYSAWYKYFIHRYVPLVIFQCTLKVYLGLLLLWNIWTVIALFQRLSPSFLSYILLSNSLSITLILQVLYYSLSHSYLTLVYPGHWCTVTPYLYNTVYYHYHCVLTHCPVHLNCHDLFRERWQSVYVTSLVWWQQSYLHLQHSGLVSIVSCHIRKR